MIQARGTAIWVGPMCRSAIGSDAYADGRQSAQPPYPPSLQSAPVARPRQRRVEFFFDRSLDEAAHLRSPGL